MRFNANQHFKIQGNKKIDVIHWDCDVSNSTVVYLALGGG